MDVRDGKLLAATHVDAQSAEHVKYIGGKVKSMAEFIPVAAEVQKAMASCGLK